MLSFFKKIKRGLELGGHWKVNKNEQGEGVLACLYVRFLKKKCWDFQNEVL